MAGQTNSPHIYIVLLTKAQHNYSGEYGGVARVSADTPLKILIPNARTPNLFTIHVDDKITKSYTIVYYIRSFSAKLYNSMS